MDSISTQSINLLSIGQMEQLYGVTKRTMRFYEQKGLLTPHRLGNRRYYDAQSQQQLELILFGKRCGLPLETIGLFLALDAANRSDEAREEPIRELFLEHLKEQKLKLAELRATIEATENYLARLKGSKETTAQNSAPSSDDQKTLNQTVLLD